MKIKHRRMSAVTFPEQLAETPWQPFIEQQQQEEPEQKTDEKKEEPEYDDPFKDVDMDILDDATKAKIETARGKLATIAKTTKEASDWKTKEAAMQKQIDDIRKQSNPHQQQQQSKTPTLEEEVYDAFKDAGLDDAAAKANTKIQMTILGKFGGRMGSNIEQHLIPLQQQTNENAASNMFEEVRSTDPRMQNDEIAQDVWDRVGKMVAAGHLPTPEVIRNFSKLAYVDFIDKNPNTPLPKIQPPIKLQSQSTRHTFPGAGHSTRLPVQQQSTDDSLDEETRDAIAATVGGWPIKPKGFDKADKKVFVTRGN